LANPDHALYLTIIGYLDGHSFQVAPLEYTGSFYALGAGKLAGIPYDSSVILGVSYFFSMLSLVTGIPVALLFSVMTAATACIVPSSTFFLCELGLGLRTRVSLAAAALAASSSLVAYTFYLDSLGAMTVIATLPVGIGCALDYFRDANGRKLACLAVITIGMFFGYFPGFAMLGLATAAIAIWALASHRCRLRALLMMAGSTVVATWAVWGTQAVTVFERLISEGGAGGSRFSRTNELLVTFALVLTERGAPFFWGLRLPFGVGPVVYGSVKAGVYILLAVSVVFFVALALGVWQRISGVCAEYLFAIGAILALMLAYAIVGSGGYGAFKMIAWIHPLILALFAAAMMGVSAWLNQRRHWILSGVPYAILGLYAVLNVANTARLSVWSLGGAGATMNNAPGLQFKDFQAVQQVADKWGRAGIEVAVPDGLAQAWLIPFLRHATVEFFPKVVLDREDSVPRLTRTKPIGEFVLHWADEEQDIPGFPRCGVVWHNDKFALSRLSDCRDVIVFGLGWYRKECSPGGPFEWQRKLRWLARRGELLILNPSSGPKRLLLRWIAGYGNSSPVRHIDVFLNGRKFDDICFLGQTRVLTLPFVVSAPWSQLEFVVREDAKPLARDHALWNRWVPADSRRLNIALTEVKLVDAAEANQCLASAAEFRPDKAPQGLLNGIYPDDWIGETATVSLLTPPHADILEISGMLPGGGLVSFPYRVPVSLDGVPFQASWLTHPGNFSLRIPLQGRGIELFPGRAAQLAVGPLATFNGRSRGTSADPRNLSIQVNRVALVDATTETRKEGAGQ
jgi:hypothetical protein